MFVIQLDMEESYVAFYFCAIAPNSKIIAIFLNRKTLKSKEENKPLYWVYGVRTPALLLDLAIIRLQS